MSRKDQKQVLVRRLVELIRKVDKTEQDKFEIRRLRQKLALLDLTKKPPIVHIRRVKQFGHAGFKEG